MDREEYIKKWINNSLTEEERQAFEKTDDYYFLERLDESLKQFKAPDYHEPFKGKVSGESKKAIHVSLFSWKNPMVRVAATVFLAVSVAILFIINNQTEMVEFVAEDKSEIFLPDSSFVQLNAKSNIAYNQENWNRKVNLEGEAFFSVKKGSRFDVITSTGVVTVVGTRFNVKVREQLFNVSCFEGEVRVTVGEDVVTLRKNDAWQIINGKKGSLSHSNEVPDWLRGESNFNSVPLDQVIHEFERQYDMEVTFKNVDTESLFTGSFTHDNVKLALKSITLPLNLSYSIDQDQVLLYSAN